MLAILYGEKIDTSVELVILTRAFPFMKPSRLDQNYKNQKYGELNENAKNYLGRISELCETPFPSFP